MKNTFLVISAVGPNRDPSKGAPEQPFWNEHEAFIDQLVDEGFILMGGPLLDQAGLPQGALLIVKAEDEDEVKGCWTSAGRSARERFRSWSATGRVRCGEPVALGDSPNALLRNSKSSIVSRLRCMRRDAELRVVACLDTSETLRSPEFLPCRTYRGELCAKPLESSGLPFPIGSLE